MNYLTETQICQENVSAFEHQHVTVGYGDNRGRSGTIDGKVLDATPDSIILLASSGTQTIPYVIVKFVEGPDV